MIVKITLGLILLFDNPYINFVLLYRHSSEYVLHNCYTILDCTEVNGATGLNEFKNLINIILRYYTAQKYQVFPEEFLQYI